MTFKPTRARLPAFILEPDVLVNAVIHRVPCHYSRARDGRHPIRLALSQHGALLHISSKCRNRQSEGVFRLGGDVCTQIEKLIRMGCRRPETDQEITTAMILIRKALRCPEAEIPKEYDNLFRAASVAMSQAKERRLYRKVHAESLFPDNTSFTVRLLSRAATVAAGIPVVVYNTTPEPHPTTLHIPDNITLYAVPEIGKLMKVAVREHGRWTFDVARMGSVTYNSYAYMIGTVDTTVHVGQLGDSHRTHCRVCNSEVMNGELQAEHFKSPGHAANVVQRLREAMSAIPGNTIQSPRRVRVGNKMIEVKRRK